MNISLDYSTQIDVGTKYSLWSKVSPAAYCTAIILIIVLWAGATQGVDSDSAWQFRAVQQHFDGASPTFNTLMKPNPADLSENRAQWIVWWAPGNVILISSLMRVNLTLGQAVRLMGFLCLALGAVGWSLWIATFRIPKPMRLLLSALLPWSVYAHNAVFYYGAETLLFGAIPWTLLLALKFTDHLGRTPIQAIIAIPTGVSLGILYILKYTGLFIAIGAMTFILIQSATSLRRQRLPLKALGPAVFCGFTCLVPVIALSGINVMRTNTMNLVTASRALHWQWDTLLFAVSNPALALASASSPLQKVFVDVLGLPLRSAELLTALVALPGAAAFWLLMCYRLPSRPNGRLACCILAISVGSVAAIWTISSGASYEPRHIAGASIAIVPYLIEQAVILRSRRTQTVLAACAICYVLLPLLYGVSAVVGKTFRHSHYRPGPSGVYNPFLSETDAGKSRSLLLRDFDVSTDVWYVINPIAALDLPGRSLIRRAMDLSIDQLRQEVFYSSKPVRVRLVLPDDFEGNGKGAVIRRAFPRAVEWVQVPAEPPLRCWVSWIQASSAEELHAPRPVLPWAE
jgi:hypothetical protein